MQRFQRRAITVILAVVYLVPPHLWILGGVFGWWWAPRTRIGQIGAVMLWWILLSLLALVVAGLLQWLWWSRRPDQPPNTTNKNRYF